MTLRRCLQFMLRTRSGPATREKPVPTVTEARPCCPSSGSGETAVLGVTRLLKWQLSCLKRARGQEWEDSLSTSGLPRDAHPGVMTVSSPSNRSCPWVG